MMYTWYPFRSSHLHTANTHFSWVFCRFHVNSSNGYAKTLKNRAEPWGFLVMLITGHPAILSRIFRWFGPSVSMIRLRLQGLNICHLRLQTLRPFCWLTGEFPLCRPLGPWMRICLRWWVFGSGFCLVRLAGHTTHLFGFHRIYLDPVPVTVHLHFKWRKMEFSWV